MQISKPAKFHRRLTAVFCALFLVVGMLNLAAVEVSAQGALRQIRQQRKQERAQKKADRQTGNKLAPAGNSSAASPESTTSKESQQPTKHSLDGIRERGIVDFFGKDERALVIPGFARPPAYMILMRQLDLTDAQKQNIRALRQRIGTQLINLRQQHNQLDQQLEDAIYGNNYDPKRVDELSAQVGEKQAEITKMQAGIESEFRQILTPDQFFVYRFLVGEMLLPQRRQQQLQRQQLQQRRLNQQNRPNQQNLPPEQ